MQGSEASSGTTGLFLGRRAFPVAVLLAVCLSAGCGSQRPADLYVVQATVSGLMGTGLLLQLNGGSDTTVVGNGPTSSWPLEMGVQYTVTVKTQPVNPTQTCTVTNGTGTMGTADVTNVLVDCVTVYGVGGTVSGLQGTGLILHAQMGENLSEDLSVAPGTDPVSFAFTSRAPANTAYTVTVKQNPSAPKQVCSVGQATGTIGQGDVLDVQVVCSTASFTVAVTVTGLAGSGLVLLNNGTDDLSVTANGNYQFTSPVADGAAYSVTVKAGAQPTNPRQTCAISNGSGTIAGASVTVNAHCTTDQHALRVTVSGLVGTGLVLTTTGEPNLEISSGATDVSFANALDSGSAFSVHIAQQPTSPPQVCRLLNADGVIDNADVTIAASCITMVAVGSNIAATSADGVTWTTQSIPTGYYYAVAWSGSLFTAVGTNIAATSPDGVQWTAASSIPTGNYRGVVWTGWKFVAVGFTDTYDPACATSTDGKTWASCTIGGGRYLSIAWNGTLLVAVGVSGSVATSADGSTWYQLTNEVPATTFNGVVWNGSKFVAVTSSDGAVIFQEWTWSTHNPYPAETGLTAIAWNGSVFAAVGTSKAATSPDGVTWTAQSSIPSGTYHSLCWTGSMFVAVGDNGAGATSPDGSSWSSHPITAGYGTYYGVTSCRTGF